MHPHISYRAAQARTTELLRQARRHGQARMLSRSRRTRLRRPQLLSLLIRYARPLLRRRREQLPARPTAAGPTAAEIVHATDAGAWKEHRTPEPRHVMEEISMRRLTYYVAATVDGFIAGPDGGDPSGQSFFPMTQDVIDFIVTHYPETLPAPARDAMGIVDAGEVFDTVLEGRASYQVGLEAGLDDAYPHLRHLVFSTTLSTVPGHHVELVTEDALNVVRKLKLEGGKDVWLLGGGRLAHSLLPEIDRVIIKQNPAVIGSGVPMFAGAFRPAMFRPVDEVQLDEGVRVLTLDRA